MRLAHPWRAWDPDSGQCVEDESDDSVRHFTIEELAKLLDDDPPHPFRSG